MKLRKLTQDDFSAIINLWQSAGLKHKPQGRDSYDNIAEQMARSHVCFIGAFENEQLVGVSLVTHDGRKGWINRIAVAPDYQKQGIAKALIKASEDMLCDCGISIFACLIEDDNAPSLELFQNNGYVLHKDILYLTKRSKTNT